MHPRSSTPHRAQHGTRPWRAADARSHGPRPKLKSTGVPRITAVKAVLVSGQAFLESQGNKGVVYAILDGSQRIQIFLCRAVPVPLALYRG